jgi:ribosomal protein S18 acetylase RimI-like enzyme
MPITVEICQQVTDEVVAAFERLVPQLSSSARVPSRSELNEIAANESLLIARDSDQNGFIVGSLTLVTFRIPTGVRAWIEDVVVDEAARGKGAGEALTRRALERAAELGSKTVDLTSRPTREAANRLYQRVGFELRHSNLYRYNLK